MNLLPHKKYKAKLIFLVEFDDLESSYDRYKVPLPQPSSMDYGAYLRKMREEQKARQREWEQQQLRGDRVPSRHSQRGGTYVGV